MRVLVADDDIGSQRILALHLRHWGHEVLVVSDGQAAFDILSAPNAPPCALLDWQMPKLDGTEVCTALRQRVHEYSGPIGGGLSRGYQYLILVTARQADSDVVAGLSAGADDYLTKPVKPSELRARLKTGERIIELQEMLMKTQDTLRHQATHDLLTSVFNRAAGLELLDRELSRARRTKEPTTVILADVDHFKKVNDTYGHPAGDSVLIAVAGRLAGALRKMDVVARYGGEEFLIVLPGLGHLHAADVAARLNRSVNCIPIPIHIDDKEMLIPTTISLGAHVCADGQTEGAEIISYADEAMYAAKHGGRDRFVFYPPLEETDPIGVLPVKE